MDKIVLKASTRTETGKQARKLRRRALVPAVMYGRGTESLTVTLGSKELEEAYAEAGGNTIIGIKIDDSRMKNILIHDVQRDSLTDQLIHADLYAVRMDEKIKTEVPIHMIGESTAVFQDGGSLLTPLETVEVEALPADLPHSFEVDIAVLDDFEKTLHVSDLVIPEGVELLSDLELVIAKVEAPRSEEELEADLAEPIVEDVGAVETATEEGAEAAPEDAKSGE